MDLLLPRFCQRYMQRTDDFSRRLIVIVSGLNKSRWRNSVRREASHGSEKNSFGYLLTCSLFSTWNLMCTEVIRFPTRRIFPKRDNLIVDSRKRISLSSGTLVFMRLWIELFTASRFVSSKSLGPSHGCEHGRPFVRATRIDLQNGRVQMETVTGQRGIANWNRSRISLGGKVGEG